LSRGGRSGHPFTDRPDSRRPGKRARGDAGSTGSGRLSGRSATFDLVLNQLKQLRFGLASKDDAKMHEVAEYMDNIFQQLDREHQKYGAPSILNNQLMGTLEAAARGLCSQHPRSTISNEAADAYRSLRALIVKTGVEP
jgi:hypothetical protein